MKSLTLAADLALGACSLSLTSPPGPLADDRSGATGQYTSPPPSLPSQWALFRRVDALPASGVPGPQACATAAYCGAARSMPGLWRRPPCTQWTSAATLAPSGPPSSACSILPTRPQPRELAGDPRPGSPADASQGPWTSGPRCDANGSRRPRWKLSRTEHATYRISVPAEAARVSVA